MGTLFYSWQSDKPNKTNRTFIKDAVEKALKNINKSLELEESLRVDQDTKDIPGTPDIANTILKKIEECDLLLSDLTTVAKTEGGKQTPNPNVLIELGYAMKAIGTGRIITVMNEAYGSAEEGLPFDLQHRRWPIRYFLPVNASLKIRKEQKTNLVSQFEIAISAVLNSTSSNQHHDIFQETQPKWKSSSFISNGERLVKLIPLNNKEKESDIVWTNGSQAFLRFIPTIAPHPRTPFEIQKLTKTQPMLFPMGQVGGAWDGLNRFGTVIFDANNQELQTSASCITQVFRNGELWGIDRSLLDSFNSPNYIASGATETVFIQAFGNYLGFVKEKLKVELPIKFIAGLSGVEDYAITTSSRATAGNCIEDEIIYEGTMESYQVDPREMLLPFFAIIWEACGIEYPKKV